LTLLGYDGIIGSFYGQPAFQRTFGTLQSDGSYQVSANWQTTIGNVQSVGNLAGLLITGYAQERFGSRKTYIAGMMLMICTIFLTVFANSIGMFMAGCTLSALPWGMFRKSLRSLVRTPWSCRRLRELIETLTTAYAAEICPINLRGLLASFVNMAWGIGLVLNVSAATVRVCVQHLR
jgi:SP family general alpha glucoside:H+ symporter-like MFS transporter